ncbi:unnamed protein product [Trifolium pratense]|uniref:Uncharacterized protein n=1 Tax=Trifolium pratense TaxID=57577 RepID=A0ACB0JUM7_TRIPR|nr:unnamed protein product [Trifolium pratense]
MAPKKRPTSPPLEDDQKPSTQKQPEDKVAHEEEEDEEDEDDSSEEEEEEGSSSEEEEEEKDQSQTASKNPPPSTPISNPKPASESESESGSESGSDSGPGSESETDSQPEPTPPLNPKVVKPLASKPMKAQPKAQTQAQTYSILARSGTKRAAENGNDSNRSKKKTTAVAVTVTTGGDSDDENENETEEDVKLTGEDSKKSTQRLFSEQDELTILKGLADFISKTKKDPLKDALAFHGFVKKWLSAEASSAQLKRKVRTLKKKFETSDSFTKPHDKKAFEFFKKVWGNTGANEAEENGKVNGKSVKKELVISTKKEAAKVKTVVDNSLIVSELIRFGVVAGSSVLNKDALERGLELIEESKRVEFVEKWKQVQIAEMELLVRRSQLAKEQFNLLLQALKKSSK